VAWCVALYLAVLWLEFLPPVFEWLGWGKARTLALKLTIPLTIMGVMLSTLHQSSLGALFLLAKDKIHPLWYSPYLPIFFFISAIGAGLAMTVFESTMSSRHFKHALSRPLILGLGRALLVVLAVYGLLRFEDLIYRGVIRYAFVPGYEMYMFWLEVVLSILLPITLLLIPKVRNNPIALYAVSIMTVFGFVVNRLNIAVTGMEASAGYRYIPKWSEVAVTLSVVSLGFVAFTLAVKYLPIFHEPEPRRKKTEAVLPAGALPAAAR